MSNEWATFALCAGIHGSIMGRLHFAIWPSQPSYYLFLISINPLKTGTLQNDLFSIQPIISWHHRLSSPSYWWSNTVPTHSAATTNSSNNWRIPKVPPNQISMDWQSIWLALFSQWTAFQQTFAMISNQWITFCQPTHPQMAVCTS